MHRAVNGVESRTEERGAFGLLGETEDWGALVVARGELDLAAVPELRRLLEDASSAVAARVVVDLTEVTFIDSLSLAAVVAARRRLGDHSRLAVVATHPYVLLIFEAGGLDSIVDVYGDRDEAIAWVCR